MSLAVQVAELEGKLKDAGKPIPDTSGCKTLTARIEVLQAALRSQAAETPSQAEEREAAAEGGTVEQLRERNRLQSELDRLRAKRRPAATRNVTRNVTRAATSMPAVTVATPLWDQYRKLPQGIHRTRFYEQHKAEMAEEQFEMHLARARAERREQILNSR